MSLATLSHHNTADQVQKHIAALLACSCGSQKAVFKVYGLHYRLDAQRQHN